MHRRNLIAAITIIAALFVVADGNLPARSRVEAVAALCLWVQPCRAERQRNRPA